MFSLKEIVILLLSKNHESYITDALNSIEKNFGNSLKIINLDFNSTDKTVQVGKNVSQLLNLNYISINVPNDLKTFLAILNSPVPKNTKSLILLSADDTLGESYNEAIDKYLIQDSTRAESIILNFTLNVTNQNLEHIKFQYPKWSKFRFINGIKLSYKNPGTGPGAVIPYELLKRIANDNLLFDTLIEDFYMWWLLLDDAVFINSNIGSVVHRRHKSNVTNMHSDLNFIYYLGFSSGLPLVQKKIYLYPIAIFLPINWMRFVKFAHLSHYLNGYKSVFKKSNKRKGDKIKFI